MLYPVNCTIENLSLFAAINYRSVSILHAECEIEAGPGEGTRRQPDARACRRRRGAARSGRERARDLVEYLVRNVAWDQVIRQLRRRESANQLSASLSDLEKALLPVLRFAKQHLEDGGELDRSFVEGMAKSLAIPINVLLDGLADPARQLARIALGKAWERTSDSATAK